MDHDPTRVNRMAPMVTHAIELGCQRRGQLRSIGAADFQHAIIASPDRSQTSIFATMALKSLV